MAVEVDLEVKQFDLLPTHLMLELLVMLTELEVIAN